MPISPYDGYTAGSNWIRANQPVVVTNISALRALDKTEISYAVTKGYYTAGDGGAGEYWYDSSDTTSTDNGGTVIKANDNGRWKLVGSNLNVRSFGAIGDGVTDDTIAIVSCFNCANLDSKIATITLDGIFLCDFLSNALAGTVLANISRNSLTISGGGTIKVKPNAYSAGVANGTSKVYVAFNIMGSYCTVQNIILDVNNQGTNYNPSASLPNVEFRHTYMFSGTPNLYRQGNNVIGNRYLNGNGQTYVGNFQQFGVIASNYAEGSIGCGYNASKNCTIISNTSLNARDAHFAAWISEDISLIGNIAVSSSNGNGIDISGSSDIIVSGNTVKQNQLCGVWVGADPNVGNISQRVLITNNILSDNQQFIMGSSAEIRVANIPYDTTIRPSAIDVVINGNRISGLNRAIFLGDLVKDIKILNNSLEPLSTSSPFPNSRIDISTTNKVAISNNYTGETDVTWNDTVENSGSEVNYNDPLKRNYHRSPNGGVLAGGAGRYNDKLTLTSTSRHIGKIVMTNQYDQGVIKVKVSISGSDKLNYREQEMIFYGGNSTTPTQDASTRVFVGTSASTGWVSAITAVPDVNGVINLYATTSSALTCYIDYEVIGENVKFYKAYNL